MFLERRCTVFVAAELQCLCCYLSHLGFFQVKSQVFCWELWTVADYFYPEHCVNFCTWSRSSSDRAAVTLFWLRRMKQRRINQVSKCGLDDDTAAAAAPACTLLFVCVCMCMCVCVCDWSRKHLTTRARQPLPGFHANLKGCSCWSMLSLAPFPVTIASERAHTHTHTHTLSLSLSLSHTLYSSSQWERDGEERLPAALRSSITHSDQQTHTPS